MVVSVILVVSGRLAAANRLTVRVLNQVRPQRAAAVVAELRLTVLPAVAVE